PVAVVVAPHARPAAGDARQAHLAQRLAGVLQQRDARAAGQDDVGLAVAVEVHDGHRLGVGIDAGDAAEVREAGHAGQPAEVLAAPADEVALGVVVELQAGLDALDLALHRLHVVVRTDHAGDDHLLAGDDLLDGADELVHLAGVRPQQVRLAVDHAPPAVDVG